MYVCIRIGAHARKTVESPAAHMLAADGGVCRREERADLESARVHARVVYKGCGARQPPRAQCDLRFFSRERLEMGLVVCVCVCI